MIEAGFIAKQFPDYAVVGCGLLLLLIASTLRFDHLVTLTVFMLSITEIEIPLEGMWITSYYIRILSRLARWFLFLTIAIKGLGAVLQAREGATPSHPVRTIALVILIFAFLSASYSMDRQVTVAAALILALVFLCAFVFLWRVVDSELELTRFVHGIYRAVWLLIVISIALIPLTDFRPFEGGRYGGIFRNANGLGLISAMLFPIAIWETRHMPVGLRRFLVYVTLFCILFGVSISGSRSAMIGVVMSAGVLLLYRYRIGFAAFLSVVLVFLLIFVAAGAWEKVEASDTEEELEVFFRTDSLRDLGGRTEKWAIGWEYIKDRPWLGWGYGTSRLVMTGKLDTNVLQKAAGIQGFDFHSSHIQTAIEMGVVGLILVEILFVIVLATGFSLFRHLREEKLPLLGVALFASLLVMIGDSFVHGWLFNPGSGMSFMFWLYTALVTRTAVVTAQKRAEARFEPAAMPSVEPV